MVRARAYKVVLTIIALAAAVVLAVEQGLEARVGQDFHVFWQAGHNFSRGAPLYHGYLPGAREFKYPPFAAMVFQPLGAIPLRPAAMLFSFLNLLFWAAAIALTRDIVARTSPPRRSTWLPVALAGVLSAQFFLDNFHHAQINQVTLVLILLGLRAWLRGQDLGASAYLVTATALKLSPIFFLAWLLIRGRRQARWAVPPLAAACVLVPLLVRGPVTGAAELTEYYDIFLKGHEQAQVGSYITGHNIASFVNRVMPDTAGSQATAQAVYRVAWVSVGLILFAKLAHLRLRRAPVSALELSLPTLASLLLSPITFTANLVFLLFVFCAFLWIRFDTLPRWGRFLSLGLMVPMALTGLTGKDLVGRGVNQFVRDEGIFVLTMLLLFLAAAALAGSRWTSPRGLEPQP